MGFRSHGKRHPSPEIAPHAQSQGVPAPIGTIEKTVVVLVIAGLAGLYGWREHVLQGLRASDGAASAEFETVKTSLAQHEAEVEEALNRRLLRGSDGLNLHGARASEVVEALVDLEDATIVTAALRTDLLLDCSVASDTALLALLDRLKESPFASPVVENVRRSPGRLQIRVRTKLAS